jgi:hypothetical protein
MTASDILAHLPEALKGVRQGLPPTLQQRYSGAIVL